MKKTTVFILLVTVIVALLAGFGFAQTAVEQNARPMLTESELLFKHNCIKGHQDRSAARIERYCDCATRSFTEQGGQTAVVDLALAKEGLGGSAAELGAHIQTIIRVGAEVCKAMG